MPASFGTSTIGTTKFSIYCTYTVNPNILKDAKVTKLSENESVQLISADNNKKIPVENSVIVSGVNDFNLYPNPASFFINVDFSEIPEQGTMIEVIDGFGRTLYKNPVESISNRINIGNIPIGLYFVRSSNNHNSIVKKLIIN
jgi:hypothetical protein